jgi:hypothetical protein
MPNGTNPTNAIVRTSKTKKGSRTTFIAERAVLLNKIRMPHSNGAKLTYETNVYPKQPKDSKLGDD